MTAVEDLLLRMCAHQRTRLVAMAARVEEVDAVGFPDARVWALIVNLLSAAGTDCVRVMQTEAELLAALEVDLAGAEES